ncbi:MAG TPA: hydrogenase maturation nickel metallochaperone HypA, partial [Tepidisphaeraceae bacterium]|nr:hydrogenase maturation nickel metallochaperone HypA [Tepidisphaeraceae bacterium]
TVVRARVGPLAGVVAAALQFAFAEACAGTVLAGARLEIENVPLAVFCPACASERTIASPQRLLCPVCGEATPDVVSGRELEVASVEVEDVEPSTAADR